MPVTWVRTPEQAAAWDRLMATHPAGSAYLLSWYLAQQRLPRVEVEIAYQEREGQAVAGAVLYTYRLPAGGAVCQVPSGPVALEGAEGLLEELIQAIVARAREKRAMLLQFEAFEAEMRDVLRESLKGLELRDEALWKLYHPTTWRELRVDLRGKDPESLLMSFRQTTRQCVRKAQKEGADVSTVTDDEDLAAVHALWVRSAEERGYVPRSLESFRALVRASAERGMGHVLGCRERGRLAAFVYAIFYGSGSVYIAGAFDPQMSRGNAHHLVHYRAMCLAMERGIPYYSLAGPGTGGLRTFKAGFRPVLVDNWRFVTVVLKPLRAWAAKAIIGQGKWGQRAKRWASRRTG
ncbi:MAG: GNAT family N-acetyltransferase [Planctomycetes bacterium]|nr:GNAT family N-acetyltransferase [Planctomycetota bacterium]